MKTKPQSIRAPADLFRDALERLKGGDLAEATAALRAGFFENLYIAPLLCGSEVQPQPIWHSGPPAEPQAAADYVQRYRQDWEENPEALPLLRLVWNDPLVRQELRSYVSLCKSLRTSRDSHQRQELLRDRERFLDRERIRRTQQEILRRLGRSRLRSALAPPFLGLVMLSSRNPAQSVAFFRQLFEIEPVKISQVAGGYAEFELHGVHIAVHGYNQHGHGDPYRLGPPPAALGWGAFFVIRVSHLDRYYENAVRAGIEVLDADLQTAGSRFFVVKDPSGYIFEITEEELRGLSETP